MNELVQKLAEGDHRVVVARADGSARELKNMIDRDYVLVKFTETRGGTELGYRLDKERSALDSGNFDECTGSITLAGNLNLNYVDVRCVATVDLATLEGHGHLEILDAD
ncbi:MAG: MbtH domain protein [Acidobacteriota bacterium]|nr:MbtH domain protein [Acidobacteriota bacterium]